MKNTILKRFVKTDIEQNDDQLARQTDILYELISNLYGADKLILRAGKLDALQLMRSDKLEDRVLALQRLVFEDPTIDVMPEREQIPEILDQIKDNIADIIARRTVEEDLEKKISDKLQERHEEYLREIKMQVIKDNTGPENAQTLKKLALLEKMDQQKLAASAMKVLQPTNLNEIIGQERPIKSLISKLASSLPQHIIIYGPPGVGKTSAARLALEVAKKIKCSTFSKDAKFVEVDGTTLRWDPREITNPLLGSVHDPIYQGARRDLAEGGVPEPKLGLVSEAHGGVLFIDEIGELDPLLQNKLLKVLEDKRVFFESSYYDPLDPNIPKYIKKLFEEGAPADFVLIAATTREPEYINPALRSRCAEIYFEPLTPKDIKKIIIQAAKKLNVQLADQVPELISDYTIEGRKATNILCDAYALAAYRHLQEGNEENITIELTDVHEVVQISRLIPTVTQKASAHTEVGRILGLGVAGFLGSVIEIEAVAFPARIAGQGSIRFNETAGSMAKDSVFNAASVIRKITDEDIANYDLHINVVGGGRIDGPSAGAAITLALLSAIKGYPIPQNIAVTGEISIQGKIRAVGGILEKIYGARQAGVKKIYVPQENEKDVPTDLEGIIVTPVKTIEEIMEYVFKQDLNSMVS